LERWRCDRAERELECQKLIATLDSALYPAYGLSEEDRSLIERELARRPRSESGYASKEEDGDDADEEVEEDPATSLPTFDARDQVARWLSYYVKQVIESDQDGIVSVSATRMEPALIVRLQEAIERDLGKEAATALLSQAPACLGTGSVAEWLAVGFFPWHVNLYRNRPIFWLVSSEGFERGKTRFPFRAYLHYLKLTPDTLPRLVSHYLESAIEHARTAWNDARARAQRLEGRSQKVAQAEAEEWLNTVGALQKFETAVNAVVQGPPTAGTVPETARWLPRTIAQVRGGQDVGHGYRPDVDLGVRVNIAPLVAERLLPRATLKKLGG
jgi:hypothetical protein